MTKTVQQFMAHRTELTRFLFAAAIVAVCGSVRSVDAQSRPARFLAKEDILLYGIGLTVEPAQQTVPKDIATIVSTYLQAPTLPDGLPPFAPDAEVRATLAGPSFSSPRELAVSPNSPFNIPPLTVPGVHTLENIRLVSGGEVLLYGAPQSVRIEVIERLLVTQVTARPLSAAEIREKGIVFDRTNFQAYNFSAAFAIEDQKVNLNFPVLLPALQGADDAANGQVQLQGISEPQLPSLQTIIPDTLRIQTQVPNLSVVGFTLKAPQLQGQQLIVPPIPGVIVIPGDIGFLNQFFSVMLMVGNVAPAGSNLVVDSVTAEIVLPPGRDGVVGSGDDPLRMANTASGQSPRIQVVVQPGLDAKLGTADDVVTIGPGETGNAEYLVEGRREGSHVVEMAISATLHGLPVGPVPVTGRAAGAVLVRNPTFTLTFTHPEVVSAGEPYTLDVTVTNTSESPANFVSVNLYPRNVSGATIVGDGSRQVESIPAGDSATVSFDLISRITGKVIAATLDSDENVAGRFALKTSVGELGVPLSPDSLVLPAEAGSLPKPLRDAAIGLLGKAWAVATAPAAALPKNLSRFSRKIVLDRAVDVAEAGMRVTLREPLADSAAQLAMDFAGSNYSRLAQLVKPADVAFEQTNFRGFDELRRKSIRGDVFAAAVAAELHDSLDAQGASAFHNTLAQRWSYRPAHVSVLAASVAGASSHDLVIVDAAGKRVGGVADGKVTKEIAFADLLRFTNGAGAIAAELAILAAPAPGPLTVRLVPRPGGADGPTTISLVLPKADGGHRQVVYQLAAGQVPAPISDGPYTITFELTGATGTALAASTHDVEDPAPTVVSVIQQKDADQIRCEPDKPGFRAGRIVAVLFSEEVTPASVQDRLAAHDITNYAPDANRVVGVALQPGRRIAFLALRDPIGPFVPRTITISRVKDANGQEMSPWTGPMEATVDGDGAVVTGRVLDASGAPIPFADVRLFYLLDCGIEPSWIGISSKNADESGRYSWDYVAKPLLNRILAVDTQNDEFRNVQYNVQRQGQRLNVDIVFLGRGSIRGIVRSEQGAPLRDAHVRVTSLTDQSQYGVRTDADGRYSIARVPVGNLFIEAVHTGIKARFAQADFIPFAGAVVERDLTLLDVEQTKLEVKHGLLTGHVYRADGITPAAGVPVFVYYYSGSQEGVNCPPLASVPCAIATAVTTATGAFEFVDITAGRLDVRSFDQSGLSTAEVGVVLAADATVSANLLLSGGLGTVQGTVVDANGNPVAGAQVGGGLSLTTTNAQGAFTLTDVPVGRREIVAASQALASSGRTTVDIIRAGETVGVSIVLEARGAIAGKVTQADGVTPVGGVTVYAFRKAKQGGGYDIVGSDQTEANGGYSIANVPVDAFKVSAFSAGFADGNIADAVVKYNGQTVKADIKFRGGAGKVTGAVYNSVGNTPLKARVGVSGDRVRIAGGLVGVGFERVENFRIVDTNLADGKFTLTGLLVGPFTLNAAGAFSPDPISLEGVIPSPGATVQMDLTLQATSEIRGTVTDSNGVTPLGEGVIVRYKSEEYKVICTENAFGETECVSIPQGIQESNVVTDSAGRFWFPLVNAGMFTLTVEDPATGKVAQVRGSVRPGEVAEMPVRVLAQGELRVEVLGSNTTTKIGGAKVVVRQLGYPRISRQLTADADGVALFAGGDGLMEGEFVVEATDMANGFAGRGTGRIQAAGGQVTLQVYLYNASGTVSGVVYDSDGLTPVPNADVVIANNAGPLAFSVTGPDGAYSLALVPLGSFTVDVFDAKSGRRATGSGQLDLNDQAVPVNVMLSPMGLVKGIVLENGSRLPLKGWSVTLSQRSAAGVSLPTLTTTTGVDGRFTIPGAGRGTFTLRAQKKDVNGVGQATGALEREGDVVDVPMVVTIQRPLSGTISGTALTSTGAPAANAIVEICASCGDTPVLVTAAEDGSFTLQNVPLGRFTVRARSQVSADAGSVVGELRTDGEIAAVVVPMEGVAQVSGVVELADGTPVSGAQVTFEGFPMSSCGRGGCTGGTDAQGRFSFVDQPARSFTITATAPVTGLKGTIGGPLAAGEHRNNLRVVLAPTATVTGRVVTAGGQPAVGVVAELIFGEGAHERRLYKETVADGSFLFAAAPLEPYRLVVEDPVGNGLATRAGQITGPLALGDIVLDEASPTVASMTPAPSTTGVPLNQAITIAFTEPIRPGTVSAQTVVLTGPSGPIVVTRDVSANDTTVLLTPLSPLAAETRYTIRVTGVQDRIGKAMPADYTAAFTTVDVTQPTIAEASPNANTGGVTIYTPVRVRFSEPIVPPQPASSALMLTGPAGPIAGRLDYLAGNTILVFTPNLPLAENASYTVHVAAASDIAGNQQPATSYQFTTTDRTPPQIARLVAAHNGVVIENGTTTVAADVGTTHDVLFVDFYVNGQLALVDRAAPFAIDFQATPQLGAPGSTIEISAVATDTSGNRGVAPVSTTVQVIADQPAAVAITAPAGNISAENGDRIVVRVRATDDLGVRDIGYRALTGKPGDALTRAIAPPVGDRTEEFAFHVPVDAEPGSVIAIQASAADTKGQVSVAAPVQVTVLDAVNPSVAITGATTGTQLAPGQQTTVVVTASDQGGITGISFTASGLTTSNQARTLDGTQKSVVTSFAVTVPSTAQPGQKLVLDATAIDRAANTGVAASVVLVIADSKAPTVTLAAESGVATAVPGRSVKVVATAADESDLLRVNLTTSGAVTFADARQITPPSNSASPVFEIPVPPTATPGSTIEVRATATDISNNTSAPALLVLTVVSPVNVTLPTSELMDAGQTRDVLVQLGEAAPAGGLTLTFASTDTAVVAVPVSLEFAAGETSRSLTLTAVAGGSAQVHALVGGVQRATMTVTVSGGLVGGVVRDSRMTLIAGAQVVVSGGGVQLATVTDAAGRYDVAGVPGPDITVRVTDPVTKLYGHARQSMTHTNGVATVNVILIPAGAIAGQVFEVDGETPAGAGVRVDIFAGSASTPLATTFTAADGRYEFPLVTLGEYVLAATGQSNRARATAALAQSGQILDVPLVYLGTGTVSGTVYDGAKQPVANAKLTFETQTVFGQRETITTNATPQGTFTFTGVPIGTWTVKAQDLGTGQGGSVSGSIARDGESVPADVFLASYGAVQGRVFRADGVTIATGVNVELHGARTVTDSEGAYRFDVVALGAVTVSAEDPGTRSMGEVSGTVAAHGHTLTADIILRAQGRLLVTVRDAGGQPVPSAAVSVTAPNGKLSASTGPDGTALIEHVEAGAFTARAAFGTLSGSTSGSLVAGALQSVDVQLNATASITGLILEPNGQTPASAGRVQLLDRSEKADIAADGTFRIDGLLLGSYRLVVYDADGRKRAVLPVEETIVLSQNAQVESRELRMVGLGTVTGRVVRSTGAGVQDITVSVAGGPANLTRTETVKTNAGGFYTVEGMPEGPFTVTASRPSQQLYGVATGAIAEHGQTVTVDVVVVSNVIDVPVTKYDANNFSFDVQPDGAVKTGKDGVFAGDGGANRNAFLLDVVSLGVPMPFAGGEIPTGEDDSREVVLRQEGLAGLSVTRKVYVPRGGYFARYLEILRNPTAAPITVDIRLRSHIAGGTSGTTVLATSSGDDAVATTAGDRDRWVTVQRTGTPTAQGFVFDGAGVDDADNVSSGSFDKPAVNVGRLSVAWHNVTIGPGETAAYLHFGVQQFTPAAALASVTRLAGLPPEALVGLSGDELQAIRNFDVPADGTSGIEPLPSLLGTVTGNVLEGDTVTRVPGATIRFTSTHPLFGRSFTAKANGSGTFLFEGTFDNNGSSTPVPVHGFTLGGTHPETGIEAPVAAGSFPATSQAASQDVIFGNAGQITGLVRRHDSSLVTSGTVTLTRAGFSRESASIGADGVYRFTGIPAGEYVATAVIGKTYNHTGLTGASVVTVVDGVIVTADITIEATGAVSGVVRTGGGAPAPSVAVKLTRPGFTRSATTSTAGVFAFSDVPAGEFTLTATEPGSGIVTSAVIAVTQDQTTAQDLSLVAAGTVGGTVTDSLGQVAGVRVTLRSHNPLRSASFAADTNANGFYRITGVPSGVFTVTVSDTTRLLFGEASGEILADGQEVTANLQLVNNAITLPQLRFDANNFRVSVQANGSNLDGTNTVFSAGAEDGAGLLQVAIDGGGLTPFTGSVNGAFEDGGRELSTWQDNFAGRTGFRVTRKIHVPRYGYYTRHIEILENNTAAAVQARVRVLSNIGRPTPAAGLPTIITTSSGDQLLAAGSDRWVVLDDASDGVLAAGTSNSPAVAFVFDGGATTSIGAATWDGTSRQLSYEWQNVTVPAGGKVALLHFVVQQVSRAGAAASAERLVQMPPEVLDALEPSEGLAIRNFNVPENGTSPLAPLPRLTGKIYGRVFAGDGVTAFPTSSSTLTFASQHPLFGRTVTVSMNTQAGFSLEALFNDNGSSIAVPLHPFTLTVKHGQTNAVYEHGADFDAPFTGNLAAVVGTASASSSNGSLLPSRLIDRSLSTAWRTANNDAANLGKSPWAEVAFAEPVVVTQVNVRGNRTVSALITQARLDLIDAAGQVLHTQILVLPLPAGDLDVPVGSVANVRRVRLTSLADMSTSPGFAELEVIGDAPGSLGAAHVDVPMANTGILRGYLTRHTGVPAAGSVRIQRTSPNVDRTLTTFPYEQTGLLPGTYTLTGTMTHPQGTQLRIVTTADVVAGEVVPADVVLPPTGAVHGVVTNGAGDPVSGIAVKASAGTFSRETKTNVQGIYSLTDIPSGDYLLRATESRTGVFREVPLTVVTDVDATRDFQVVAAGTVNLAVHYASGQPVGTVSVSLKESARASARSANTSGGSVTFTNVAEGPWVATVKHPANTSLVGELTGTLQSEGEVQNVTLTLPVAATVEVQVNYGAGGPAQSSQVALKRAGAADSVKTTPLSGLVSYTGQPAGPITITANHPRNRKLVSSIDLTIESDATLRPVIALPALATVTGTVFMPDGSKAPAGVSVTLGSSNPAFTTTNDTTDDQGVYSIPDVPAGSFTIAVVDGFRMVTGTASSVVGEDQDGAQVSLHLQLQTLVQLPATFYDANAFAYDVQNGMGIGSGRNTVFGVTPGGAAILEITPQGGTARQFSSNSLATADLDGRQLSATSTDPSGLKVTRKVYVPTNGYFTRYVDTVTNPGPTPVTLDLKLQSHAASSASWYWFCGCWQYSPATVVTTSSGDTTFEIGTAAADRWVILDDTRDTDPFSTSTIPSVGFMFDGTAPAERATLGSLEQAQLTTVSYGWSNVTVPPGASVAYMHFVVQQASRAAAQASMERLGQLPPEALEGLSAQDRAAIRNFAIPEEGSTLEPLPALFGTSIAVQVVASDNTTPIAGANVSVRSTHPLFARTHVRSSGTDGTIALDSLRDDGNTLAIPRAPFTVAATKDGRTSPTTTAQFADGETTATARVSFANTSVVRGRVVDAAGAPVVAEVTLDGSDWISTTTGPDGTFEYLMVTPGTYRVYVWDGTFSVERDVKVVAGVTTIPDIAMPGRGSVDVQVVRAAPSGAPAAGVTVSYLDHYQQWTEAGVTNAAGQIRIDNVALGARQLRAYFPGNPDHAASGTVTLAAHGDTAAITLVLPAAGSVTGRITLAGGFPLDREWIALRRPNGALYLETLTTSNGDFAFQGVPPNDAVYVEAQHPNYFRVMVQSEQATLTADGETRAVNLAIPAAVTLNVQAVKPGIGGGGRLRMELQDRMSPFFQYVGTTSIFGDARIFGVAEGPFTVRLRDEQTGILVAERSGVVAKEDDFAQMYFQIDVTANPGTIAGQVFGGNGVSVVANAVVAAHDPSDGRLLISTKTAADGAYQLTGVVSGPQGVIVRAHAPGNPSVVDEKTAAIATAGETVTVNFQLPLLVGTITGTVRGSDGATPVAGAVVSATETVEGALPLEVVTNADGEYTIVNAGFSGPFTVTAAVSGVSQSQPAAFSSPGETLSIDFMLPVITGTVSGQIVAGDGTTPVGSAWIVVQTEAGVAAGETYSLSDGSYSLTNVHAPGTLNVRASYWAGIDIAATASVAFTADERVGMANLTLPLSIVKGRVTSNGGAVPHPSVFVEDSNLHGLWANWTDVDGNYLVFGAAPGGIRVTTQSGGGEGGGITNAVHAEIVDVALPVIVNIDLPGTGSVAGAVFDGDGNTVAQQVLVRVQSDALSFELAEWTTLAGDFTITGVPEGPVVLRASYIDPVTSQEVWTVGSGVVTADELVTINLHPTPAGVVTGRVLDGELPVAYAEVQIVSYYGPFRFSTSISADENGVFTQQGVPAGDVYLTAWDSNFNLFGKAEGILTGDATLARDIMSGTAVTLTHVLAGDDGFEYAVDDSGTLYGEEMASPYRWSYELDVNGSYFCCSYEVGTDTDGRQLNIGPLREGGMLVTRRVFVPQQGGFARYLEVVHNPTSTTKTVSLRVNASPASFGTEWVVAPTSTGRRYAVSRETVPEFAGTRPVIGHVMAGEGVVPARVSGLRFSAEEGDLEYQYTVTIPPGERRAVMHFTLQRAPGDAASAQAAAEALVNLSEAHALAGLSAGDKAMIVNFNIPQ